MKKGYRNILCIAVSVTFLVLCATGATVYAKETKAHDMGSGDHSMTMHWPWRSRAPTLL